MTAIELIIFAILFISHSIFLGIVLFNYSTAPRLYNTRKEITENIFISILIPVRNEEKNIGNLLNSISQQSYDNYEVIVLDDNSEDQSTKIVQEYSSKNSKVKLVNGKSIPSNWLGKNWACYQLSKYANGEYLLFVDADVTLNKHAVSNAIYEMQKHKLSLYSVFPTQKLASFGEWLVVPLMNWLLLNFLPLKFVNSKKSENLAAANGQFSMMNKEIYEQIGTHEAVKNEVVEDMQFVRLFKRDGYKVRTSLGEDAVFCKMYNSFSDSVNGFVKNFYKGFNVGKTTFIILLLILFFMFTAPLLLYFFNDIFMLIVLMIFFERIFISIMSKQNWFLNLILHPFQMIIMLLIGLKSVSSKYYNWKERIVES